MQPFYYQQRGLDEIIEKFNEWDRVCYSLATSGGKTAIFSFLSKWWINNTKTNILILAHRSELITQAEATLSKIGIGSEVVFAKHKKLKHHSRVYISMVETADRRLQKNPFFFTGIGLVICDEAHVLIFSKVFNRYPDAKVLGCTATPVLMKRITFWKCPYCRNNYEYEAECCDTVAEEWTRPYSLSHIFQDIVVGPAISELIDFGSVVREITFIKHYTDDSKLKTDSDGEFTTDSVEQEYGTDDAAFNVILNYKELCHGKKTMVFNSSTKANLLVYEKFLADGFTNVRMFDSVNKEESGSRPDLLKWFDETPDAILLNCNTFTAGFDSKEVQAIIINRPIGSLSLFIQIVGRGARSSDKIFKDNFILVDGGGNVDRFGEWSQDRDWRKIFFEGNGKERAKKLNAQDIHDCPACGALYLKSENECPECGHVIEVSTKKQREEQEGNDVLVPIREVPPPRPEKIYEYVKRSGGDLNTAWRILIAYIVDMFRYYQITKERYERTLGNGNFEKKILKLITPSYFALKGKKDLESGIQRTRKYFVEQVKSKLEVRYNK
jgi:superfamily II DNA or RNA helicase